MLVKGATAVKVAHFDYGVISWCDFSLCPLLVPFTYVRRGSHRPRSLRYNSNLAGPLEAGRKHARCNSSWCWVWSPGTGTVCCSPPLRTTSRPGESKKGRRDDEIQWEPLSYNCPDSKDLQIDIGWTLIQHESVGSMSNRCRSESLSYIGVSLCVTQMFTDVEV